MEFTVHISGMHCGNCVHRLEKAFSAIPGVTRAKVTLDPPHAHIGSERPIAIEDLQAAARGAGAYDVRAQSSTGHHGADADHAHEHHDAVSEDQPPESLYPLGLIVAYIVGVAAIATFVVGSGSIHEFMRGIMAGFFLVFSGFKLLDLRGFADAYQTYDLIARRSRPYALAYPFIELALGIAYLTAWHPTITNTITAVVMSIGAVGVIRALMKKSKIRCACLGTSLNLPMTKVTVVEDVAMAAMAIAALVWPG